MDHPTYERVSEQSTTLLILNDYSLMKIFKFFALDDFVNVYNTCERLRNICASVCALKYKKIIVECNEVSNEEQCKINGRAMSKQEFIDILSVIGTHVLSVVIEDPSPFVIDTIRDKCKNITSFSLFGYEYAFQLQGFRNLKKLNLNTYPEPLGMDIEELKTLFKNNPDLESVDCECWYHDDLMETLTMLPKLKTLVLPCDHDFNVTQHIDHLLRLDNLTTLTLDSSENCNQLLIKLSKNLKLKELRISASIDTHTFRIMESFRNVEDLELFHTDESKESDISGALVFPSKLKHIRLCDIRISCTAFLSIVKQLKFLRNFEVDHGDIYWDRYKSIGFRNSKLICRIANELRGEIIQPELKISFSNWSSIEQTNIIYNSARLFIVSYDTVIPQCLRDHEDQELSEDTETPI